MLSDTQTASGDVQSGIITWKYISPHVHLECTIMSKVSVFKPQDDPLLSKRTGEQSAGFIKGESRSYQRSALLQTL